MSAGQASAGQPGTREAPISPEVSARVAMLIHGFLRTGASMGLLAARLKAAGYTEILRPTFGYHLRPLEQNAERAVRLLTALRERYPDATIDIVTHSMGGLLTRAALGLPAAPQVRRVVMLSPPNQGAQMAARARALLPVHRLGWDPLHQLLPGVPSLHPLPTAEVGVLTGGTGLPRGYNALLGADNDLMVRVDEAHLPGATDFHVVPVPHAMMPFHGLVSRQVLIFLNEGRFLR